MGRFAVATGHERTTEAVADVLRAGGNAVDGAIAGALMACIAEPVLASPMAGGFMLVVPQQGAPELLDAFVQTPAHKRPANDVDLRAVKVDFGATQQMFHCGAGTIASPGLIPGIFAAHARFGRMPMRDLAAPAVAAAREGLTLNDFQAEVLGYVAPIFRASPQSLALYGDGTGLHGAGATLRNPEMADVLEVMALEGPRFFQEGEVAQALLALDGGHLQAGDLAGYRPVWRKPLTVTRGKTQVLLNPAPSLGGVQIALALAALPVQADDALLARALFEIGRIRKAVDLDHHPDAGTRLLLDPAMVNELRATLAAHTPASRGTTHISVIDSGGMGVGFTLSNGEGCGLIAPGTGIMPNNMLGEDDLVPDGANSWHTGRRLASMMCPAALFDEGGLTILGSGGSNRIRSALTKVMLELADGGAALEQAILAPRLHVESDSTHGLDFEDTGGAERRESLLKVFPEANIWPEPRMFFGGVHAARRDTAGHFHATGDPRRAGSALSG